MKFTRCRISGRRILGAAALVLALAGAAGAQCPAQVLECGGTADDLSGVPPLEAIRMNAGATALEGAGLGVGVLAANGTNCSAGQYARGVDASGNAESCTADSDTDTTCNDAGVSCLFAGSATEGGAATTALALAADGANCSVGQYARGVAADGSAQSCTADADTTCNDAGVACLFAGSATEGGPAATALALNANGANCSVGEYARGVDAAGAAEGCTAIGAGDTTCLDVGVVCAFAGSATEGGPATTALALNANGGNCTAGNYPLGVDASGAVESCTALPAAGHGDGANCSAGNYPLGVDAAGAVQSCTADDDVPEVGDFGALVGGAGITNTAGTLATASSEQAFLASGALTCGAATNGKVQVHTTPLQYCDNAATPTLRYAAYGNSAGVATSASALAANGANCAAGTYPLGVDASGAVESCGSSINGNAATATALAAEPPNCVQTAGNSYASGISANGSPEGCLASPALTSIHVMAADDTFASTTLLRDGPEIALASGQSYIVTGVLHTLQAGGTANIRVAMVYPGTPSFGTRWSWTSSCDVGNTDADQTTSSGGAAILNQTANTCTVTVSGYFRMDAGESGTFKIQFAQGTSNVNNTTVRKGSYLTALQVSDF